MKYYEHLETGSIYRTEETTFNDGTPTLNVERWNWDFKNWSGHIHNHAKTRAAIKEGDVIVEISEELAHKKIHYAYNKNLT